MQANEALSADHLKMLREESGISDAVIEARGYWTITDVKELVARGFSSRQLRVPGLLLPLRATDGSQPFDVYRPDSPYVRKDPATGKEHACTYEIPAKQGVRLDCPPICRPMLADPSIPLWITEGQKKADALASLGACAVALLGVWNFKGKNPFGGITLLADFDYIALNSREVRIVFDSDVMTKSEIRKALERLTEHLQRKSAHVSALYLPAENGKKVGVDDYLAAGHTLSDLEALIEGPRPQPQPAHAMVELLDDAPLSMCRPLALVDGHAYAAIWPHVKVTITETTDRQGTIVKLNPPTVKTAQRLLIVRDDGRVFGEDGDEPLDALGIDVHLPEIPPTEKLWSTLAVKAYKAGARPHPADVFTRLVEGVDRFIDFDRSLADQRTMCEMVACYILATWFLDTFTVIGFLWPNGDRGSGKTQLLLIVTELAYLGQTILAGGSYASLRDLADYGATLAFDDAENLSDPKRSDPDKRTLLLAGNRRGNTVPVKEPGPDRTWRTRHVNTFCPRLFSAIRLPDDVLSSRSIVVPLIRTPDRYRANADPLDYKLWPHDRRKLVDDLWALALAHLPELSHYEMLVNDRAELTGRTLEPWRAILAVALWLDDNGMKGVWKRMNDLSKAYQKERLDLESSDLTALVISALCHCAIPAISAVNTETPLRAWALKTEAITAAAKALVSEIELDLDPDKITSRRVGRVLSRMRFEQEPRPGGRGGRLWRITAGDLQRWAILYAIPLPDTLSANGTNGFSGTDGANPQADDGYSCPPNADGSAHAEPSASNAGNAENAGNAWDGPNGQGDPGADHVGQEDSPDADPDDSAKSREQQPCRFCHKPECRLTPGGQFCRLSPEDKQRWGEPGFSFADDARDSWEDEV